MEGIDEIRPGFGAPTSLQQQVVNVLFASKRLGMGFQARLSMGFQARVVGASKQTNKKTCHV
jgi:hypothetical protein